MKRKDIVFQRLKDMAGDTGISASDLAAQLGLDRANVSSDLNKLWKEGRVIKHQGRPVLFSVAKGNNHELPEHLARETVLDRLAKQNTSLRTAVEQGKAAILYPPDGMHLLILGETGVGKSMFAELLHQYAVEVGKMSADAPFVTFNCADYANNPQLLMSQLFGVKKGAYTGAVEQDGLIAKADGGLLLLDEIHRLPPEGQEMLFTFIDKGVFRKLGETEVERRARVLLVGATTEDPSSHLLNTFRRRIAMVIQLPTLRERTVEERYQLLLHFFQEEAIRLGKEIHISPNAMRAFLHYRCTDNIGQLKTDIQLTCAKAYADFVTNSKPHVQVNSTDLLTYIKEGLLYAKRRQEPLDFHQNYYIFYPDQTEVTYDTAQQHESQNIYEIIEQRFRDLTARGIHEEELDLLMKSDIENYFTQYFKRVKRRMHEGDLAKIIEPRIITISEHVVNYVEEKLGHVMSEKMRHGLALHIQTLVSRIETGKRIVNPQLNSIRREHKKEFAVALDCIKMIEDELAIDLPIDEAGFLTMFFVLDNTEVREAEDKVRILVVTHGSGGATAMADVANQLLGTNDAAAIDMPLSLDPQDVYTEVKKHVQQTASQKGVLLLVDMGSLVSFGDMLQSEVNIPVQVLPMVSTPHVLEAARKAMLGYSLQQIYEEVKQLSFYEVSDTSVARDNHQSPKWAIVTACLTGQGSALALKKVLEDNLHYDEQLLEIIPINIVNRIGMERVMSEVNKNQKLLCIVSNFTFDTDIPQYHIEDVLSLKAVQEIQQLINTEETYHKMAESLKHHLQSIDAERIVPEMRACLDRLQVRLHVTLPTNDLIGIVLHGCCMVDRVVSGEPPVIFENREQYVATNERLYRTTRDVLAVLEKSYQMKLGQDEICFMMRFFDPERLQV